MKRQLLAIPVATIALLVSLPAHSATEIWSVDGFKNPVRTWDAEGAKFLNDLAVDSSGRIYVSDMLTYADGQADI